MELKVTVTGVQREINAIGNAYGQRLQASGHGVTMELILSDAHPFGEFLPGTKVTLVLEAVPD